MKAEIEKTAGASEEVVIVGDGSDRKDETVRGDWIQIAVEIPGTRDDDASTVFLGEMLREALLADGEFAKKLWINRRFHWRLYLDVRHALSIIADWSTIWDTDSLPAGFADFTSSFISPASPFTHHASRPSRDEVTTAQVRRR